MHPSFSEIAVFKNLEHWLHKLKIVSMGNLWLSRPEALTYLIL